MADGDLFIPDGAYLKCDKGATITQLKATPKKHFVYDLPIATESDKIPIANIPSFGVCSINGKSCVPTAPEWKRVHDGALKVQGKAPLLTSSFCKCQQGGTIDIFLDKEAAEATLEGDKKDRVDGISWLDSTIGNVLLGPVGAVVNKYTGGEEVSEGIGRGVRSSLKGTWNFLTDDMWKGETWKGMGKVAAVGIVGYGGSTTPSSAISRLSSFDNTFGTDLLDTHNAIGESMADSWDKNITHGTKVDHAEVSGQIIGGVLEAAVGSKGAGAVAKGVTGTAKLAVGTERMAKLTTSISKLRAATKLSNIAERVKGIFKVGRKKIDDMSPGSPGHKAQRWKEYQERGGEWDYDRWSKTYDNNMQRARKANQAADNYHESLGWGEREVTVDVNGQARRLDIADVADRRGVEVKSGEYFSRTEDIMSEIARDKQLVQDGWEIDWVIEGRASQPLLDELKNSGINVIQK